MSKQRFDMEKVKPRKLEPLELKVKHDIVKEHNSFIFDQPKSVPSANNDI